MSDSIRIEYQTDLTSEKAVSKTLKQLLKEIKGKKLLKKVKQGQYIELVFGEKMGGSFTPFQVQCEPMVHPYQNYEALYLKEDSDAAFFEVACSYPESSLLVVELVNLITEHNGIVGKYEVPYRDEEQTFGLIPAMSLLRSNVVYCRIFGEFLKTLDLDHGVYEFMGLHYAFQTYGVDFNTMGLLAISLFSAVGQNTDEDFEYFLTHYPIEEYLNNEEFFQLSCNMMMAEFMQIHDDLKKFYSDFYLDVIDKEKYPLSYKLFTIIKETYDEAIS